MMNPKAKHALPTRAWTGYLLLLWFPLSLLWQELVIKVYCFSRLLDRGLLYVTLFTFALGCLLSLICIVLPPRGRWISAMIFCGLTTLWYMIQTVYYTIFKTFLVLYSVSGAGNILQFWEDILSGIGAAAVPLLLLLVPFVLLSIFGRRATKSLPARKWPAIVSGALTLVFHAAALMAVGLSSGGVITPRYLYFDSFVPNLSVSHFGVMTTLRLDARQLLFAPAPSSSGADAPVSATTEETEPSTSSPSVTDDTSP